MKKAYFVFLFLTFNVVMSQNKDKLYPISIYEKAWTETNSEARLKLIKTVWLDDSTFEDPSVSVKGISALNKVIHEFYQKIPGATFTLSSKIVKDNYVSWDWKLFGANKKIFLSGRDFARLNGKGQISKIISLWDPDVKLSETEVLKQLEEDNLQIVANYYECLFKKGDFKTLATLIDERATYNQAEGLPYGGTYVGFTEWTKMFSKIVLLCDFEIEKEPVYFTNTTETEVVMCFTIKAKSKKSGKLLSMPISEKFDLKNGKIIGVRPFLL